MKLVHPEIEKILDYMELVRELDKDKLLIFVNMRCYFGDEEMEMFIESALAHEFNVFFIESSERKN